jgi:hypothetical protein
MITIGGTAGLIVLVVLIGVTVMGVISRARDASRSRQKRAAGRRQG